MSRIENILFQTTDLIEVKNSGVHSSFFRSKLTFLSWIFCENTVIKVGPQGSKITIKKVLRISHESAVGSKLKMLVGKSYYPC